MGWVDVGEWEHEMCCVVGLGRQEWEYEMMYCVGAREGTKWEW